MSFRCISLAGILLARIYTLYTSQANLVASIGYFYFFFIYINFALQTYYPILCNIIIAIHTQLVIFSAPLHASLPYAWYVEAETLPPRPVQLTWMSLPVWYFSEANSGLMWKV